MTNNGELSAITADPFSSAVSNFRELISSCDSMAFLIGAGCSKCAGLPLTKELTERVLNDAELDCASKGILVAIKDIFAEASESHIEDYLSEIVDLHAITERRSDRGVKENTVAIGNAQYTAKELQNASEQIKRAIAKAIEVKVDISMHRDFVTAVHRPVRIGRPAASQPVDYLVLNYDTIIEDALGLGNIPYADGLSGGASGWWEPKTFEATGLAARVIKIHGSIDWHHFTGEQSPRRIRPSVEIQEGVDLPVLIWPSSNKYQEAHLDPFAQLLDFARAAMRPTYESQRLLVVCGYSFGDRHINLEIDHALKDSKGKLTIAVFTDGDEPSGQLKEWHDSDVVRDQVLIFANRGFFHGEIKDTSPTDLAWWKFEVLTKIFRGEL